MITQKYINSIAYKIVGCAIEVHKQLGPGLLESVYEVCLIQELKDTGLRVESQVRLPIVYKGRTLDKHLRMDIVVEDLIVVELKAVETMIPLCQSHLRLSQKPKGLLINFNCANIVENMTPLVTELFAKLPVE